MILTLPRNHAPALPEAACWRPGDFNFLEPPQWHDRTKAETDESLLQPIVYLLLRNDREELWCYRRRGGDQRLDGSNSCGVGGHVDQADFDMKIQTTLTRALRRELTEELGPHALDQCEIDVQLQALIYEGLSAVGRVHLGLLYLGHWHAANPPRPTRGEKLEGLGFKAPETIHNDPAFELWSRLAVGFVMGQRA